MSRVTTPPQAKTTTPAAQPTAAVPQEKIAQRAYEKWMKRGCAHGAHLQDWAAAEAELKAEMAAHAAPTSVKPAAQSVPASAKPAAQTATAKTPSRR